MREDSKRVTVDVQAMVDLHNEFCVDGTWQDCQRCARYFLPEPPASGDVDAALSRDNPNARWHREERPNGWSSWACVPLTDAIEAAIRAEGLDGYREASDVCSGHAYGQCGCTCHNAELRASFTEADR